MVNKIEVDVIIGVLQSLLTLVETVDPNAAQNKVVQQIQAAIKTVQALGL